MFKRPPTLKPLTPLRSSARRSFLSHLQELYPILANAPPEVISQVVPNGLKHCNASTSSEQKAVIYTDDHGKPLWFELGSDAGAALQQSIQKKNNNSKPGQGSKTRLLEVFPTVYVLFVLPNLLPRLPTWPQLVEPTLCSGSSLMLPGLIPPPNTFPEAQMTNIYPPASSIIAITPYPSLIPWVVARSELDMEEMCKRRAAGDKGKAATTIHYKGDFLWEMGGKGEPPGLEEGARIEEALKVYAAPDGTEDTLSNNIHDLELEYDTQFASEVPSEKQFTVDEVDAIMHLAFLQALVKASKEDSSLPTPLSSFFSSQILPNRPSHWPPRDVKGRYASRLPLRLVSVGPLEGEKVVTAEHADIKHTSAKKLTKWIKRYEKKDLIRCKEVKGNELVIIHINAQHEDLKDLVPFYTISQLKSIANGETEGAKLSSEPATASNKNESTIILVEKFWRASASSVKLFQEMGASTSQPLSQPIIRDFLLKHITTHSLIDAQNQAQIRINEPNLVHALYPKAQLHEIPASLTRQEMVDRLLATSCVEYHRSSRLSLRKAATVMQLNSKGKNSGEKIEADADANEFIGSIIKGGARPIKVEIKTRQGKKVVSLITGLEIYGIDSNSFAHDLMKLGASASGELRPKISCNADIEADVVTLDHVATPLPGSTPKAPKYEVFVQGDQRKAISDFLDKRGINREIVQVHDGTKK